MFENFPYVNFHDLNLDWIIQRIMEAYGPDNPPPLGLVLSVNGMTGEVVLFREQNVQLPSIDETSWNLFRVSNEVATGLKFTKGQPMERVDGANRYKVYDEGNPPPAGEVSSVDGMTGAVKTWANSDYQTLETPTTAPANIWDLRRTLSNGDKVGIEFEYDSVHSVYKAYLKYTPSGGVPARVELLSSANIPESGVVSVNNKTGIVNIYATDIALSDQSQETIKQAIDSLITTVATKYTKPAGGIPASDIASGVIPDVSQYYILPAGGIPASELAGNIPASKLAPGVIPTHQAVVTITADGIKTYGNLLNEMASYVGQFSDTDRIFTKLEIGIANCFTYSGRTVNAEYFYIKNEISSTAFFTVKAVINANNSTFKQIDNNGSLSDLTNVVPASGTAFTLYK